MAKAARAAWLAHWNLMRRYHRYEVVGLERLERDGPALLVGYHGRPIARDLCMLQALMHARKWPMPVAVMHRSFAEAPVLRWIAEGMEFVIGDGAAMESAIARGAKVIVTPGGTREGCRSRRHRYRVDWGSRTGYVKLAIKYRLPIIPIAASGVDDAYLGLNDGHRWGRRLGIPRQMPAWLGLGPLGLWPMSPPFPVKIVQLVGPPIEDHLLWPIAPDDPPAIRGLALKIESAVQKLLDQITHRPTVGFPRAGAEA